MDWAIFVGKAIYALSNTLHDYLLDDLYIYFSVERAGIRSSPYKAGILLDSIFHLATSRDSLEGNKAN